MFCDNSSHSYFTYPRCIPRSPPIDDLQQYFEPTTKISDIQGMTEITKPNVKKEVVEEALSFFKKHN